jgi:WD40 repeat protein
LSTLAISPDGRTLVSASGFEDSAIRVWDAETGRLLFRRNGHTSWVGQLAFTRDGRRLISAATDQSIRFWDTSTWTEMRVLRGHTDEAHAVAISDAAHLVASAGKDGNLILWDADDASTTDGYRRLPEDLGLDEVLPLDQSRVLLLPQGKPPRLVDFKGDSTPQNLPGIGSSKDVLGWFGTNILCLWNGADQVLVQESREPGFTPLGAIVVESGTRPSRVAYNAPRQFLAWAEENSPALVHLQSLASPGCQIELNSDVAGLRPFCFSGNGSYLAASAKDGTCLRVWNVETGRIVASINEHFWDVTFAAGGKVLVLALPHGHDHEIVFCDLLHPERIPRRVPGRDASRCLAVSPDGGLVAASDVGGLVRLFDPTVGKEIASVHGHLNAAYGVAFSPDGRRLISAFGTQEAIKVWDVETRQELLTLGGAGTMLRQARWTADGDVILVGAPWQAWRAPSWEEISIAEAKEKTEISRAR